MARRVPNRGSRLEALLDERDHLRIQLSLADNSGHGSADQLKEIRLRLALLSQEIDDYWSASVKAKRQIVQSLEQPTA